MNITIITILLPYPLDSGGAQAQFNMIENLRHSYHITLAFPENSHNSKASLAALQEKWPEVNFHVFSYRSQLMHLPFLAAKIKRAWCLLCMRNQKAFQIDRALRPYGYDISYRFVDFVNKVLASSQPDLVQVEFYPYLEIVNHMPKSIRKIFVHHEIRYVRNKRILQSLSPKAKDIGYMKQLKQEEIANLNQYDEIITLTDVDRQILIRDGVTIPVSTSPAAINARLTPYQEWNRTIIFVGGAGHGPNVEGLHWLMHDVLPLINWKKYPDITFKIIGKGWNKDSMPNVKGLNIECTGFVKNLADKACGGIMVVPILSGSGMRMKILEGAAMSMPMLSTTVGAEGLDFKNGESCLIADAPQDFADALTMLFSDNELRKRMGQNANNTFQELYSVEALCEKRKQIYQKIIQK